MSLAPGDYDIQSTTLTDNHYVDVTMVNIRNQKTDKASIDLDSVLGNVNGALSLGHNGFSKEARNVTWDAANELLTAELPDLNGDYTTSEVSIVFDVGTVDDQLGLRFSLGVPHSLAHADAESIDEADARILDQIQTSEESPDVTHIKTLSMDHDYGIGKPDKSWIKDNLGPYGHASPTTKKNIATGFQIAGAICEVLRACVIM